MHTKPYQCILTFLALLGTARGSITPVAECTAQAWVRAPDLIPNAIIHGDARVKISAECPAIEHVSLGLRFKERSFVKALGSREDVKWLNPEPPRYGLLNTSPWASTMSCFANKSVEEAYEEVITNKDLWIVRDEERVAFETTQPINMGSGNHDGDRDRDVVQEFSILVPSTNFPPALDFMRAPFLLPMEREIMHVEWIYEYFAQMSFANGTTQEISAGFTTFRPLYDPASISRGPSKATVGLKQCDGTRGNPAIYSIEISAESGLTFFSGAKSHVITAIITRTGFARTFSAPLSVLGCVIPNLSSKWAAEYDMSDVNPRQGQINTRHPLGCSRQLNHGVTVIMPNSTSDEIRAHEIVTTTSAAFTISIDVNDTHMSTFETFYQTLANSLTITLELPLGEEEEADPEDPSGERDFGWGPQFEDDEDAWVPWEKTRRGGSKIRMSYSGGIPVVVHPIRVGTPSQRCLHPSVGLSGQVVLSDETSCEQHSLIHYLDEGARGPTFVDRSAIHDLLAEDPAKRELRALVLAPVVSSPPAGGELAYRYYRPTNFRKPHIYVGETWAKKVVDKDRYQTYAPHPNV